MQIIVDTTPQQDEAVTFAMQRENAALIVEGRPELLAEEYLQIRIQDLLRDMTQTLQDNQRQAIRTVYDQIPLETQAAIATMSADDIVKLVAFAEAQKATGGQVDGTGTGNST